MEFASEFICLSVCLSVCLRPRPTIFDGQTNGIHFIKFVCLSYYLDLTDEFVCLSPISFPDIRRTDEWDTPTFY
jgi:hypothetical protein